MLRWRVFSDGLLIGCALQGAGRLPHRPSSHLANICSTFLHSTPAGVMGWKIIWHGPVKGFRRFFLKPLAPSCKLFISSDKASCLCVLFSVMWVILLNRFIPVWLEVVYHLWWQQRCNKWDLVCNVAKAGMIPHAFSRHGAHRDLGGVCSLRYKKFLGRDLCFFLFPKFPMSTQGINLSGMHPLIKCFRHKPSLTVRSEKQ